MEVAEQLDATVANMRFVKPLDEVLISELADSHDLLVSIEENALMGGAGSAIAEYLHTQISNVAFMQFGLPDDYLEQGTQAEQLEMAGLSANHILTEIQSRL
jgi:1-deoxy-D-xylulose-5-phosphate synthase